MTIEEYTEIIDCDGQGIRPIQDISRYQDSIYDRSYACNSIYEISNDKFRNSVKTHNLNIRYYKDSEYNYMRMCYGGPVNRGNDFPFTIRFITNRLSEDMYYYRYRVIFSKDKFLYIEKEV